MSTIKVTVNHNRCVGSRLCVSFMPGVFSMNEQGQSTAVITGGENTAEVLQTAEQCPQCAIRVEDTETDEVLFPPADLEM